MTEQPMTLSIAGMTLNAGMRPADPLVRAVVVSLFTWRRAEQGDPVDGELHGWWGDTHPVVEGDRIGSRLWLLARSRLDADALARAREYAQEALQWLVDDGVAARVDVQAERLAMDRLLLRCVISRVDGQAVDLRFEDVWGFINAV